MRIDSLPLRSHNFLTSGFKRVVRVAHLRETHRTLVMSRAVLCTKKNWLQAAASGVGSLHQARTLTCGWFPCPKLCTNFGESMWESSRIFQQHQPAQESTHTKWGNINFMSEHSIIVSAEALSLLCFSSCGEENALEHPWGEGSLALFPSAVPLACPAVRTLSKVKSHS